MDSTFPDGIGTLLMDLKEGVLECLKSSVIAIYVYGSVVMGDFVPQTSDIDFLVIVHALSAEEARCLETLHEWLAAIHEHGKRLEGDYLPLSQLTPRGGSGTCVGYYKAFDYRVSADVIALDTLAAISDKNYLLYGPHPAEVIPRVKEEDLKEYMVSLLSEYKEEFKGECHEDPGELALNVLNMSRAWYGALHGKIVSKSEAAFIAVELLPERWHPLIQAALEVRCGIVSSENEHILRKEIGDYAEFLANMGMEVHQS